MKPVWKVRRSVAARDDGQRRWDYAYQFLLQWATDSFAGTCSAPPQQQAQTIDQQLDRLRAHIVAQPDWHLAEKHIYRDDGYSDAQLNRPGLDRLRDHAAFGAFGLVLITAPDRLARFYVNQVVLIDELANHGCSVMFLYRPMSADPHDQLLHIRGAVANMSAR
jgi:site-specific DNA recombinase